MNELWRPLRRSILPEVLPLDIWCTGQAVESLIVDLRSSSMAKDTSVKRSI